MTSESKNSNHDQSQERTSESPFDFRYFLNLPPLSPEEGANIWRRLKDSHVPEDIDRLKEVYARLFVQALIDICPRPDDLEVLEKMCHGWNLEKIYEYCRDYDLDNGCLMLDLLSLHVDRRAELFVRMESEEWMLKERYAQIEEMIRTKSEEDILRMNEDLVFEISAEIGENPENVLSICRKVRWAVKEERMDQAFKTFLDGASDIEEKRKPAVLKKYLAFSFSGKKAVLQHLKIYEDPDGESQVLRTLYSPESMKILEDMDRKASLSEEEAKDLAGTVLDATPRDSSRRRSRLLKDYLD